MGRASGWLGRAQRLLDREEGDRVERGYLLLPVVFEQEASGDLEAAAATAGEAAAIGERFGDPDLFALAAHEQGHVLIRIGRIKEGLRLLDEAMVAVTAGELSPIVSGIVYCGVILACQDAYEVRRAQEWTAALTRWCERQPDLVAFTGRCLVHRAEIMQLAGRLVGRAGGGAAGRRALPARARTRRRPARPATGRGRSTACSATSRAAEEAYRRGEPARARAAAGPGPAAAGAGAGRRRGGRDPQGRRPRPPSPASAPRLLPAFVEIMLAVRRPRRRRAAPATSSRRSPTGHESGALGAMAAQARGAVELAEGDARGGPGRAPPRRASVWQQLEAPYEAARVRVLVGLACRALGDEDTAALELEAARAAFAELGAAPDLARLDSLAGRRARRRPRAHRARARGAAPPRRRRDATRRSPPSSSSASARWTGT